MVTLFFILHFSLFPFSFILQPFRLKTFIPSIELQLMRQDPFDLAIGAAKFVRRPLLECVVDIFI